MKINENYLPIGHPNRPGIKLTKQYAIIIHYTANDSSSATDTANASYIGRQYKIINNEFYEADGETKFRYGSAHVFCDEDSITRTIPYDEISWNCGDRQLPYSNGYKGQTNLAYNVFNYKQNYMTIGVEICNNGNWEKSCNNAIEEIVVIMKTCDIPLERIFRHYDITGKICPKPFIDENKWKEFINRVNLKFNSIQEEDFVDKNEAELVRSLAVTIERITLKLPIQAQIDYIRKLFDKYIKNDGK